MNKSNVANWIKKEKLIKKIFPKYLDCTELDELYWFIGHKINTKIRENVYIMTMVSRQPRMIVGVEIAGDKLSYRIQKIVDNAPDVEKYCSDSYGGHLDVIYLGKHIYNTHNKKDTF